MSLDSRVVDTLVERLRTKLPHRTGFDTIDLRRDELSILTRATLLEISGTSLSVVVDALLALLEELSTQYRSYELRPVFISRSEAYVVQLLADCFAAGWEHGASRGANAEESESATVKEDSENASATSSTGGTADRPAVLNVTPRQTRKLLRALIPLLTPQGNEEREPTIVLGLTDSRLFPRFPRKQKAEGGLNSESEPIELDTAASIVIRYLAVSNWEVVFHFWKERLNNLGLQFQSSSNNSDNGPRGRNQDREEAAALAGMRVLPHLAINKDKLSSVIQEVCRSFLHLRKSAQVAIVTLLPQAISEWIDDSPDEFVELHLTQRRLEGGPDVFFDMSNSMPESSRHRRILWPLQLMLALLIPELFWVVSSMREARSANVARKAAFIDSLRKSMRSSKDNDVAACCMITLCRVARYFSEDSDSALLSYALDVQDELRREIFDEGERLGDLVSWKTVDLMTATFTSLAHLDLESLQQHLITSCLSSEVPIKSKIATFGACAELATEDVSERYQSLFHAAGSTMHVTLKDALLDGKQARLKGRDRGRNNSEAISFRSVGSRELILALLKFSSLRPETLLEQAPNDPVAFNEWLSEGIASLTTCLADDDEKIRSLASELSKGLMKYQLSRLQSREQQTDDLDFGKHFWTSTSLVLSPMAKKILEIPLQQPGCKMISSFIHEYLQSRVKLLKTSRETESVFETASDIPERIETSCSLEIAFLVLLCSSDLNLYSTATESLDLLLQEGKMTETVDSLSKSPITVMRNFDVYSELTMQSFPLTGLVAFQKRFRKLMLKLSHPTVGILTAWETIYSRWKTLNRKSLGVSQNETGLMLPTESPFNEGAFVEWRNYSGLLASVGGICIADLGTPSEEKSIAGLRWIDRVSSDGDEVSLLESYLKDSIHLLVSADVRVREATRDVLGAELSPKLFPHLVQILASELELSFIDGEGNANGTATLLVEQTASLLRGTLSRLEQLPENFPSVDFGSLAVKIGQHLQNRDSGTYLRTKIKVCQLYEGLAMKKDTLNLRQDVRVRNQLVDLVLGWMSRSGSSHSQIDHRLYMGGREDDLPRLQRDLDRACLKSVASLSHRLPLQGPDTVSDPVPVDAKPQLFQNYFNKLLSLLQNRGGETEARKDVVTSKDEYSSTSELVIVALSNLLSANVDVGLQQSIGMAYHEDLAVRTAFLRILCNILLQGTEFNTISGSITSENYDHLIELILNHPPITLALYDSCPASNVDEMAISLFNLFVSRGKALDLLRILIEHEVNKTENETEILRRNCVATKLLSIYAKWKGTGYLKFTLQGTLNTLLRTSGALVFELDPTRTESEEELQSNVLQLRAVTTTFIDAICKSSQNVPPSFRTICNVITSVVANRFPDAKFTAVGAFVFLRFFCPAIVAPDAEGLMSAPPSKETRRGLLLVAKVVQNLANNVLFGAKEPYMFPLNDFLLENIFRVTEFLMEISAPIPGGNDAYIGDSVESYDLAACSDMHRIFYDQSDSVKRSTGNAKKAREQEEASSLDEFEALVSELGPPPINIAWTKPSITENLPVLYSRFQAFMLENAGRNAEDFVSTGAVYDGGQSKDELPTVCLIQRNIQLTEANEDLLIYSFFKVASRMWHRPFGVLLDVTCSDSSNEPDDRIIKKLESLRPAEVLRIIARDRQNMLHPSNVEYHLLGSLQELQQHFNLGALHLPKDTISVVADSKFVFEPVTRLSKTKGRVEMVIKVGGQFIQITTVRKQDIVPGFRLSGTVNDIFRVAEMEETGTSFQIEDDGAFGLRTDGGKIAMYFTSPRRSDILLAIRAAKVRQGREARRPGNLERSTRPEDVPGSLLNISLMNLAAEEPTLRVAAFNLLCCMCQTFHFAMDKKFVSAKDISIPPKSVKLLTGISKVLAEAEPQLTQDFLTEFFVSWNSSVPSQHSLNILYMIPWLSNLRSHVMSADPDGERAKGKVVLIIRKLVDIFIEEPNLYALFQNNVCPVVATDEFLTEIFLDELVKAALSSDLDWDNIDKVTSLTAAFGTVITHGKVISKLRKILNRSSLRHTKNLAENPVWTEFCALLRIYLGISFNSNLQAQSYLPELFHVITMAFNCGPPMVRRTVHSLLVHILQSLCGSRSISETDQIRLKAILTSLSEPKLQLLFNIQSRAMREDNNDTSLSVQASTFASTETLATLLLNVITVGAPSLHCGNAWRSRWMSLVASTAFQNNPAMQSRAFVVMGCLARGEVDDDLLYQVLVTLRNGIGRYNSGNDPELLPAIIPTLTKMVSKLSMTSRYVTQMFWLAIALLRFSNHSLYNSAATFLGAVVKVLGSNGRPAGDFPATLLRGRALIEDSAAEMDGFSGIHFTRQNFHIATSATIMKGLTNPLSRTVAAQVLSDYLEIVALGSSERESSRHGSIFPYVTLQARSNHTLGESALTIGAAQDENVATSIELLLDKLEDTELLLNAAMGILELRSREDVIGQRILTMLHRISQERARVLGPLYNPITSALDDIILSSQSPRMLRAAHTLGTTLAADARTSGLTDPDQVLDALLDSVGLEGLFRNPVTMSTPEKQKQCGPLIERLIESMIT